MLVRRGVDAEEASRQTEELRSRSQTSNITVIPFEGSGSSLVGEQRIDWDEAVRRHPHDPTQPNHTFYFHIEGGQVIDALYGGNDARWINHACEPNCEADEVDGQVFIQALRDIEPGEELFYDYGLVLDERHTAKVKKQFACWCGALTCRGTMLAPKTRRAGR